MEHSIPTRLILLFFYPIRVAIHLAVFVFWAAQFYLFPSHTPEIRSVRNETLLIFAGVFIVFIFAEFPEVTVPNKLIWSLGVFVGTWVAAHLLNAGDEGYLN